MARRSVLLSVAIVIALLGTALIVLYVQGIDKRATEGQELVEVLAATATIDPVSPWPSAMEAGKFEKRQVRRDDMVDGALSSTGSISDLVSLGTIYAGEQVIAPKFGTLSDTEGLIIPDDKVAISVELSDPARVAGFVNPGSDVAIFLSADPVQKMPDGTEETLPGLHPRAAAQGPGHRRRHVQHLCQDHHHRRGRPDRRGGAPRHPDRSRSTRSRPRRSSTRRATPRSPSPCCPTTPRSPTVPASRPPT